MKHLFFVGLILLSPMGIYAQNQADLNAKMAELEYLKTHDPSTGTIPVERLHRQAELLRGYGADNTLNANAKVLAVGDKWIEMGPTNVAGRVRTIVVLSDKITAFAAGVSGGIWKCNNIKAATPVWRKVDDFMANLAVSSIAIDPNTPTTMYAGTGEGWYNPTLPGVSNNHLSANWLQGAGIWKSTNSGKTWSKLTSTNGPDFFYNQKVVAKKTGANTTLFTATLKGLFRSTDGGANWSKVLGNGFSATFNSVADIEVAENGDVYATIGIRETDGIYKSVNDGLTWTKLNVGGSGLPTTGFHRIELACGKNGVNTVVYAAFQSSTTGGLLGIYKNVDAGNSNTWTPCTVPPTGVGSNCFYHLCVSIDPNNHNTVYLGAEHINKSTDGGVNWTKITASFMVGGVHADQHVITFEPGSSSQIYIGNDGGIARTSDATNFSHVNTNLNITQFFTCAMRPAANDYSTFLAGAQDNGTQKFTKTHVSSTDSYLGGDGAFCHFDDNLANIVTAIQETNTLPGSLRYSNSTITNAVVPNQVGFANPLFILPTELDRANDILYTSGDNNQIIRYTNIFNLPLPTPAPTRTVITISSMNSKRASTIRISPHDPTTIYVGTETGTVLRLTNANTVPATPPAANIKTLYSGSGYVSDIAIEKVNTNLDDNMLISHSNYGTTSIVHSSNATSPSPAFSNLDNPCSSPNCGSFGDIPVRSVLFAPGGNAQGVKALIGTELGVWATDAFAGLSTVWYPINTGLANVRVSMLKQRTNDNTIIAATLGRGLYRTDMFQSTKVDFTTTTPNNDISCPFTLQNNSTNGNNPEWDIDNDGVVNSVGNTVTLPANTWNLDQIVTLYVTIPGTATKVSIGKSLYTLTTATNLCAPPAGGGSRLSSNGLNIYPNPSEDGKFSIIALDSIANTVVYNIEGKKIWENINSDEINIGHAPIGIYFATVTTVKGEVITAKIIRK